VRIRARRSDAAAAGHANLKKGEGLISVKAFRSGRRRLPEAAETVRARAATRSQATALLSKR
jgi:hypothetical protein